MLKDANNQIQGQVNFEEPIFNELMKNVYIKQNRK